MVETNENIMNRCLELAARGLPAALPNPLVGAVLVDSQGKIAGEGYHVRFGEGHAEANLIRSLEHGRARGGRLFVNLEPCAHHGKTPPCCELVKEAGVSEIIVGTADPYSKVRGRGIAYLRSAGIKVSVGCLAERCLELNKRFFVNQILRRPYVILKWAQTSDGYMARPDNTSRWISCEESRELVHSWRAEEQAIMVGSRTARTDNPALTARLPGARNPTRVVLDRAGALSEDLTIFDSAAPTLAFTAAKPTQRGGAEWLALSQPEEPLVEILSTLHSRGIGSLIVEGGPTLLSRFIALGLWDEARVFRAPVTFGSGLPAPGLAVRAESAAKSGADDLEVYRGPSWPELRRALKNLNEESRDGR